jgi:hypothetical protein
MFDSVPSCGASSSVMIKLDSPILNCIIFSDLTLMAFPGASLTNEPGPALFLSAYASTLSVSKTYFRFLELILVPPRDSHVIHPLLTDSLVIFFVNS